MKFLFILSIFLSNIAHSATYYVSTSGLSTNPGSILQPWSISHAFLNAVAGDTVWVKAGNYGIQNLNLNANNTTFLGYTNFPGEITQSIPDSLSTFLVSNYDLIYPTIDGVNRATAGTGIDFGTNKSNITIKNFQIRNYQMGISIVGRNNFIENIIGNDFGNVDVFYNGVGVSIYGNKNSLKNTFVLNGAAEGIRISGDSNLVQYCKVYCNDTINAMEQGNSNTRYGDTDYYLYITANTNTKQGKYNVVEYCYLERISRAIKHIGHGGHGFSLTISYNHKPCASGIGYCYDETQKDYVVEHNIIRNCTTKNIDECILLRGDKVKYNLIEDVSSLSYGTLRIQNSCSYNTFNRCHIKNSYYWKSSTSSSIYRLPGFDFFASYYGDSTAQNISSPETNSYPWEVEYAGHHNTISNSVFENVAAAVTFNNYSEFNYPSYHPLNGQAIDRINRKRVESNNFINCTFIALKSDSLTMLPVNRPTLFNAMRGNANNIFTNCIFDGFYNFESRSFALNTSASTVSLHGIIPTNVSFKHCLFNGNNFDDQIISNGVLVPADGAPLTAGSNNQVAGTFVNCIVQDPLFFDSANGDYSLDINSPCIDAGASVALVDDFEENPRPSGIGYDIGAFEFQNSTSIENSEQLANLSYVFPNPTNNCINIQLDKTLIGSSYLIYDITGKKIMSGLINSENMSVDIGNLSSGTYLLKIDKHTFKVIKE